MTSTTFLDAITAALIEEMERDPAVFLLGEDIATFGGAFKVTKGLLEKFGPERVMDMPIAESGFTGMAIASAIDGLRPVVEYQFADFITCAFDQIVNYAAKSYYRWGYKVPIVLRAPTGAGVRGGPYHSISPEAWFAHVPGLKVVYPSTPSDAKGLLKSAIRDDDPVIYLEHKKLYRKVREDLPDGDDVLVPLGRADVKIDGDDVSVITYGAMVHDAAAAIERIAADGYYGELVDLRSIAPLDIDTVLDSVAKTGRALVVTEEHRTGGFGGEVAARLADEGFEHLDAPVRRLGAVDVPHPVSPVLEDAMLPSVDGIYRAMLELVEY